MDVITVPTDTCDAKDCPARAYLYAELKTGSLSFCGSHGRMYLPRLTEVAVTIVDLTHLVDA